MIELLTESEEPTAEAFSAIEEAALDCLIRYWSDREVSSSRAERAAREVIELLRHDERGLTWCVNACLPRSGRIEE
jgi:hypothetical protein